MQNEFMAIDIEFHERKDSPQIAIVKVGDRMVAMEIQDWLEFAKGVSARIEAHLTKRAADVLCTCGATPVVGSTSVCLFCGLPKVAHR